MKKVYLMMLVFLMCGGSVSAQQLAFNANSEKDEELELSIEVMDDFDFECLAQAGRVDVESISCQRTYYVKSRSDKTQWMQESLPNFRVLDVPAATRKDPYRTERKLFRLNLDTYLYTYSRAVGEKQLSDDGYALLVKKNESSACLQEFAKVFIVPQRVIERLNSFSTLKFSNIKQDNQGFGGVYYNRVYQVQVYPWEREQQAESYSVTVASYCLHE